MIYPYVLGGQVVHFWTWNKASKAEVCGNKDGCDNNYIDWEYQRTGLRFHLALLRTCRSMYVDSNLQLVFPNLLSIF